MLLSRIQALMSGPYVPPVISDAYAAAVLADNPLAYYKMQEIAGTTLIDEKGAQNGNIEAGVTINSLSIRAGNYPSIRFNGTATGRCTIPNHSSNNFQLTNTWSKDFWVKAGLPNAGSVAGYLVMKLSNPSAGTNAYAARIDPQNLSNHVTTDGALQGGGVNYFSIGDTGMNDEVLSYASHVAVVRDPTLLSLYVDGVVEATKAILSTDIAINPGTAVEIGGNNSFPGSYNTRANMSDLAFYGTNLSASRIYAHYLAGLAGDGTFVYDSLDGGVGSIQYLSKYLGSYDGVNVTNQSSVVKYRPTAVQFNTTTSRLYTTITARYQFLKRKALTLDGWFYMTADSNLEGGVKDACLRGFNYPTSGTPTSAALLVIEGDASTTGKALRLDVWSSGGVKTTLRATLPSGDITKNTWHYYKITRSTTDVWNVEIDGTILTISTNTILAQNLEFGTGEATLGGINHSTFKLAFQGYLSEQRICRKVTSLSGIPSGVFETNSHIIDTFDSETYNNYGRLYSTLSSDTISGGKLTTGGGSEDYHYPLQLKKTRDSRSRIVVSQANDAGMALRVSDVNNAYLMRVCDASAPIGPNTVALFKKVGGSYTQVGSSVAISFTRGTTHTFEFQAVGTTFKVWMDGTLVTTWTDSSLTFGFSGFRTTGATGNNIYDTMEFNLPTV